jgi:hypothetical protein
MVRAFHGDVDVVDAATAAGVRHLSDGRDHALLVTVVHADQALVGAADLYFRILFRNNTKNWKVHYNFTDYIGAHGEKFRGEGCSDFCRCRRPIQSTYNEC